MPLTPYRAVEIAEGFGEPPAADDQVTEAWQYLHDSGLAYTLQGWFGRTCQHLINEGIITS